jgi:ribosome-binding protein aMBF1 (putative translation factor)
VLGTAGKISSRIYINKHIKARAQTDQEKEELMSYLKYSKKALKSMEYSVTGLELDMRYDVMNFIRNMKNQNYSQKKLAKKLKMQESQLNKILSGEENLTLKEIAKFFNVFKKKPLIIEARVK